MRSFFEGARKFSSARVGDRYFPTADSRAAEFSRSSEKRVPDRRLREGRRMKGYRFYSRLAVCFCFFLFVCLFVCLFFVLFCFVLFFVFLFFSITVPRAWRESERINLVWKKRFRIVRDIRSRFCLVPVSSRPKLSPNIERKTHNS